MNDVKALRVNDVGAPRDAHLPRHAQPGHAKRRWWRERSPHAAPTHGPIQLMATTNYSRAWREVSKNLLILDVWNRPTVERTVDHLPNGWRTGKLNA